MHLVGRNQRPGPSTLLGARFRGHDRFACGREVKVTTEDAELTGKITPEGIEAMRARIGVLIPEAPPWVTEAHQDSIRHFAYSFGDDNPLFTKPGYGPKTVWGKMIAPPMFVSVMGESEVKKIPDKVRKAGAGALTGVPQFLTGNQWEWLRPITPGDKIRLRHFISDVQEKRSQFGGGKAVVVSHRLEYVSQKDELVALYTKHFFHVERQGSQKTGKNMTIEPKVWTDSELEEIDAAYEKETRRGSETLYWEDVSVGMTMPTMVKGPLCPMDIIWALMGRGFGNYPVAPLRLGYLNRKRTPAFYSKNEFGAWDAVQRDHWENARAQKTGNPRAFDYGWMRTSWLLHYLTNWIGDDGFVWKETDEARKFNYHGDVQWITGKVTGKRMEDGRNIVEMDVWCENQRGEIAAPGQATVILPTKTQRRVVLPGEAGGYAPTPMKTPYAVDIEGCIW